MTFFESLTSQTDSELRLRQVGEDITEYLPKGFTGISSKPKSLTGAQELTDSVNPFVTKFRRYH